MKKRIIEIGPIAILITIICNIIAYNYLPDNIGLQVNTSGDINNYISKNLFVVFAPIGLALIYLF